MTVEIETQKYQVNLEAGRSIAIPLDFEGPQPNHFGVQRAAAQTVSAGEFVGDTRRGGSCNVKHLSVIPHCNGTHTESVGHIVDQPVAVGSLLRVAWLTARLVTVKPVAARETSESYRPELDHHDEVITAESLSPFPIQACQALVIRTATHQDNKPTVAYGTDRHPAFLTVEAMQTIAEAGIDHLLLDLPSVDKMYDEGLLTNHHLFWNVAEGTHQLTAEAQRHKTITEMIYVADEIPDGVYMLNIQIPDFVSDAAPSRPVLFPLVA